MILLLLVVGCSLSMSRSQMRRQQLTHPPGNPGTRSWMISLLTGMRMMAQDTTDGDAVGDGGDFAAAAAAVAVDDVVVGDDEMS